MSGVSNIVRLDNGTYIGTLLPFHEIIGPANQLSRDRIMKAKDQINEMISKSRWHFQTNQNLLDLGAPYVKISPKIFLLRDDWSVEDVFKYWEENSVQLDCLIILNLLLLFYLRDELSERNVDSENMRSAMNVDVSCGLMKTGLHELFGAVETQLVPLGDLNYQREVVRRIGPGYYCYCRGPIGWYDCVYGKNQADLVNVDTVYQGENAVSLGNSEFLTFSRDYYGTKLESPQLVIKNFEYILNELWRNGRDQLSRLYPSTSTTFVTTRCGDQSYYQNKFSLAGIEALQLLGTLK